MVEVYKHLFVIGDRAIKISNISVIKFHKDMDDKNNGDLEILDIFQQRSTTIKNVTRSDYESILKEWDKYLQKDGNKCPPPKEIGF